MDTIDKTEPEPSIGYIPVYQEFCGIIRADTPRNIMGLTTEDLGPCAAIAARYGNHDFFLCHADNSTDLEYQGCGLYYWTHNLFHSHLLSSFLIRPITIIYSNDGMAGIHEEPYENIIGRIIFQLQQEYFDTLISKYENKAQLYAAAQMSFRCTIATDEKLKERLVSATPAPNGMKAVIIHRDLVGSGRDNIQFCISLPREARRLKSELVDYIGSIVHAHGSPHFPPICIFDGIGSATLKKEEVIRRYKDFAPFSQLVEILSNPPHTPTSSSSRSEEGEKETSFEKKYGK